MGKVPTPEGSGRITTQMKQDLRITFLSFLIGTNLQVDWICFDLLFKNVFHHHLKDCQIPVDNVREKTDSGSSNHECPKLKVRSPLSLRGNYFPEAAIAPSPSKEKPQKTLARLMWLG